MPIALLNIANTSTLKLLEWANTDNKVIRAVNVIMANTDIASNTYVNAFVTSYSNASNMLVRIKTVDGPGSGLDADLLDGQQGGYYVSNTYLQFFKSGVEANVDYISATYAQNNYVNAYSNASNLLSRIKLVDGPGSGLDADSLDGQSGAFYSNASNMSTGTLPAARFTDTTHGSRAGGTLHAAATTATAGFMSSADKTKLDGVEALADVTDAVNVGSSIHGTTAKTTPVDADTMPVIDSAATNTLKKVTWANVKATLKTYFDTLYATVGRQILAGNGLTGGGTLSADRTLTLGTPSTITESTTNNVTTTSHTHAMTLPARLFPTFTSTDSTTDLNTFTTEGWVGVRVGTTNPNIPAAGFFNIFVTSYDGGTVLTQTAYPSSPLAGASGRMYLRRWATGVWSSWVSIPYSSEVALLSGATFTGAISATSASFSGGVTSTNTMGVNGAAASDRTLNFMTAGSARFSFGVNSVAESGSNAGSDFAIHRFSDTGAYLNSPITISRSAGSIILGGALNGTTASFSGSVAMGGISSTTSSAVGAGSSYLRFNDSAGTRLGYVGAGSTGNGDVTLTSDVGNVRITAAAGEQVIVTATGGVALGSTPVTTTGAITAGSFSGSGASLTSLNASNLGSGTVPSARITGAYTGFTNVTGTGTADFSLFYGNSADTAAAPSFSWTGDPNTGIWNAAADQIGFSTGGTNRMTLSSTGLSLTGTMTATTFSGSGASLTALSATQLTTGTVPSARITGAYTGFTDATGSGTATFADFSASTAGTALLPAFTWAGDPNTGMWNSAADQIGFTTAGVNRMTIDATTVTMTPSLTVSGNLTTAGNMVFDSYCGSSDTTAIVHTSTTGTIYLRPGGSASTTNQVALSTVGFTYGGNNIFHSGNMTTSTAAPSGGVDGDLWFRV